MPPPNLWRKKSFKRLSVSPSLPLKIKFNPISILYENNFLLTGQHREPAWVPEELLRPAHGQQSGAALGEGPDLRVRPEPVLPVRVRLQREDGPGVGPGEQGWRRRPMDEGRGTNKVSEDWPDRVSLKLLSHPDQTFHIFRASKLVDQRFWGALKCYILCRGLRSSTTHMNFKKKILFRSFFFTSPSNADAIPTPSEFVQFILDRATEKGMDRMFDHFNPQHLTCKFCSVQFDVIGTMENFNEDVEYIKEVLNLKVIKKTCLNSSDYLRPVNFLAQRKPQSCNDLTISWSPPYGYCCEIICTFLNKYRVRRNSCIHVFPDCMSSSLYFALFLFFELLQVTFIIKLSQKGTIIGHYPDTQPADGWLFKWNSCFYHIYYPLVFIVLFLRGEYHFWGNCPPNLSQI